MPKTIVARTTFQAIIVLQILWAAPSFPETAVNEAKFWTARWNNHELQASLFQLTGGPNDNITVYSEEQNLDLTKNMLYTFIRDAWSYTVKTYGIFGNDPNLNLLMPHGDSRGQSHGLSVNMPNEFNSRNLLDFGSRKNWFSVTTRSTDMDVILEHLAYFVEASYKNRHGSPSYNIWKEAKANGLKTAWNRIFTYDVYTQLKLTQDSTRYRLKHQKRSETTSSGRALYWFRDWILPIYTTYGRSKVLQSYFELLHTHFPSNGQNYARGLNKGEFIHFWSGAAKSNLNQVAFDFFGWNIELKNELVQARKDFPEVSTLYLNQGLTLNRPDLPKTTGKKLNESSTSTATTVGNQNSSTFTQPEPATDKAVSQIVIIGAAVGAALVLIAILALIACVAFYKKKVHTLSIQAVTEIRSLTDEEVREFFDGDSTLSSNPRWSQALVQSKPFIKDFEIPRERFKFDPTKVLGTGQFGSVVHGSICLTENGDQPLGVAIKLVKKNVDVMYFKAFLSEVKIMACLGSHGNIVELHATCTTNIKNREIFIALEFCPLGNLENYLKANRSNFFDTVFPNKTPKEARYKIEEAKPSSSLSSCNVVSTLDLISWSKDIANAMVYLTQKKVIHGDLAARNVLLTHNRVAKISDFGLSRQFLNYENYMKTSKLPVPWRWLAVECLKEMSFSTASDIWAFGVTMWEIFSLAELPYGAWTFDLFFVDRLISGDRLLKPSHANDDVYGVMMNCWIVEATERPSFQKIYSTLESFLPENGG